MESVSKIVLYHYYAIINLQICEVIAAVSNTTFYKCNDLLYECSKLLHDFYDLLYEFSVSLHLERILNFYICFTFKIVS